MAEKLEIEIGADVSGLKSDLNKARDDIKGFKERSKSDTAIELSVKVAELKTQLQNVRQLIKQDIPPEVEIQLTAKAEILKREVTQAGRELTNFLRTGQKDVSVLGTLFSNLGTGLKQAFTGDISGAMSSFKTGLAGIGTAAITAFAGFAIVQSVIGYFSSATTEARAFGQQMAQLKAVSDGTESQYRALSGAIKSIAEETGVASIEIAKSAVNIAQAGVDIQDIPKVLETVTKAAVVNGSDTSIVFQGLSSAASTYGIAMSDIMQVSDLFFRANKEGKLSIEGLSNAIGTVAPIANTAGVSLKELIAGFATMAGTTGNADEVATQLKGSIQAIAAPSAEATVAARQLGIELGQQAIANKGYAGVMKEIYDKTGGNLDQIKTIIPEVRALTAVTYLGAQGSEQYKKNLDGLNQSLGDTQKSFTKYSEEEVASINRAEQTWANWKLEIGSFFTSLYAFLINSATYLNKWIQLGVAVVGEFVIAFGTGFVMIGEAMGNFLGFLVTNLQIQGGNLSKIAENVAYNMGQAFNDIPGTIAKALTSALLAVMSFFSKSLEKYNEFVDFIGQGQLKVNANIGGGTIDSDNIGPKFRSLLEGTKGLDTSFNFSMSQKGFAVMGKGLDDIKGKWADLTTTVKAGTVATANNVGASTNQVAIQQKQAKTLDGLNAKLTDLKAKLGKEEIGSKAFKDLQKEIVSTQSELDKLNEGTAKPKKNAGSSAVKKEIEAQKKAIEEKANAEIKATEASTLSELEKAKKVVAINKKLKTDLELIDGKYADVQAKNAEEIVKNSEESMKKIKKGKEDAYKDLTDAEKKNLDDVQKLGNAYADLKNKLAEVGKKGAEDIKQINDEIDKLKKNLADIQSKGKEDIATRGIQAAKELKDLQDKRNSGDGWTIDDYQTALDLQKEIDLVNSNTTPEERAKALVESQKSKTQLLIDELKLNEDKAKQELATAEAKKKATEDQLALDKKAIQDKIDAIAIQITNETAIMLAEDIKRRKLEADYTDFFGEQMSARKQMMDDLIAKAREAQIALQSAGISTTTGSGVASTNSTANNTVFNITNNKDVDAESFLRAVNNKMPTK